MSHHTRTQHHGDADLSGPRSPSCSPLGSRSSSTLAENATETHAASLGTNSASLNVDHSTVSAANQEYLQTDHAYPLHTIIPITSTNQYPHLTAPLGQVYEDTIPHLDQSQPSKLYIALRDVAIKPELSPAPSLLLPPSSYKNKLRSRHKKEGTQPQSPSALTMPRKEKQRASARARREGTTSSTTGVDDDGRVPKMPDHYNADNIGFYESQCRTDWDRTCHKKWRRVLKNRDSA